MPLRFLLQARLPLALLLCTVVPDAESARPFEAEAIAEDGSGLREHITASSFRTLITDVIRANNQFSKFEDRASFFSINYLDLEDAFTLEWSGEKPRRIASPPPRRPRRPPPTDGGERFRAAVPMRNVRMLDNAREVQAVFEIPVTGFRKTFTGETREEVEDEIIDFLNDDGEDEYRRFLEALNERSKVSPLDGNPNAATARAAAATFTEFGQLSAENLEGNETGASISAELGRFAAGEFEGDAYALPLSYTHRVSDKVSIVITAPLSYIELEGAEVYNTNIGISVPIRFRQSSLGVRDIPGEGKDTQPTGKEGKALAPGSPAQPWTWQVTPTVGGFESYSSDLSTAGLMGQASLTNLVAYRFERLTLTMGNHISWLEGYPGNGRYTADPGVSQVVMKNGLQALVPLGDRWEVSAYGIYTRFLQDAGVDEYFTVGGEIGYKPFASSNAYLRLGFYSDLASDYKTATLRIGSAWKF